MKPLRKRMLCGAAATLIAAVVWGESVSWRASRSRLGSEPTPPTTGGPVAVVVFGFRNRGTERANALNRWRVRTALRSASRTHHTTLICCGGDPGSTGISEAQLLARYAVGERGWTDNVELETASTSTWENVLNVIPLIEDAAGIVFASDPLHALKARLYLTALRPDLAARLVRAKDFRLGEWALLKPFSAIYGLRALSQAKRIIAAGGPT
ncbi:MAG: YdcF family protein [Galactobacter sp.]